MGSIADCTKYLKNNAKGKWYETHRMLNPETDTYYHPVHPGMVLLRVETGSERKFFWIYNIEEAVSFNEHVGLQLKIEAHEIIISTNTRLFFDIDLELNNQEKEMFADHYGFYDLDKHNEFEIMEIVGKEVAEVFKEAILISFGEHGIQDDEYSFDYTYTMRNRSVKAGGFKISIHIITNIILPLKACSAIASDIKKEIITDNIDVLGIDDQIATLLVHSIDETQYRRHGSLGLPLGTKNTSHGLCTNWIYKQYSTPNQLYFITQRDSFSCLDIDMSGYNILENSTSYGEVSSEFVKEALKHVNNIKDYNSRVWDIKGSVIKKSCMFVKRRAPSNCTMCDRVHDNDNTLLLLFNSELGTAAWKCYHMKHMKPIEFYKSEFFNADDINAFATMWKTKKDDKVRKESVEEIPNKEEPVKKVQKKSTPKKMEQKKKKKKSKSKGDSPYVYSDKGIFGDADIDLFISKHSSIKQKQVIVDFESYSSDSDYEDIELKHTIINSASDKQPIEQQRIASIPSDDDDSGYD